MADRQSRVELYFLRHADAGDPEAWTRPDAERPLSPKGRRQAERLGRHLAALGFEPDAILTSPKVRAAETAEIVGEALGRDATVVDGLAGPLDIEDLAEILADQSSARRIVVVGHDPDFSELAAEIVGAPEVALKKGALARIDLDGLVGREQRMVHGMLRWLLPPDAIPGD
jgi:phosphohistidine phosphatase